VPPRLFRKLASKFFLGGHRVEISLQYMHKYHDAANSDLWAAAQMKILRFLTIVEKVA
jgi:hypothetical protein